MSSFEEKDLVLCKTPDTFELSSRDDENQNLQLCRLTKEKNSVKNNSDFDTNFETLSPIFIRKILKSSKIKIYTNHFLLIAMVEYICNLLNSKRQKSVNYDFSEICQYLVQLGLFDSMLTTDFFRPIRIEYLKFLHAIFNKTIPTQLHLTNKRSRAITNVLYSENDRQKKSKKLSNLNSLKVKKQENLSNKYSYQYFYNLSRYKTDFEEIEKLASGGFGSVYKAKNIIDQKMYAIKKIHFKNTDQSFCQRVIRETELLATLDHENIVNYNSSWIELDYASKLNQNNRKESIDYLNESKSCSNVKFEPSSQSNKSKDTDQFYNDSNNKHLSSSEDDFKNENEHPQEFNMQNSIVLYIQMKLCDFTLKEWIQSRNESIFSKDLVINSELNLNIFRQILSGVEYLHSRDIIHRDLKPGNIFMIKDTFQIKIGDFGLACLNILHAKNDKGTDINPRRIDHTKGVGTTLYASPEQLNGKIYDLKTDIYSLGIILFELFCPFNTEMERIILIRELKVDQKLPQKMENELIDVCAFIKKMLSSKPIERPSAHIILNSQLFMTKDQVIEQLQKLLEEKKKEIHNLKNVIAEKDEQLKDKEMIITKFKEILK